MTPRQLKIWNEHLTPLQRRYAVAWHHYGWTITKTGDYVRRPACDILKMASIKPHKTRNSLKRCAHALLTRNDGLFAAFLEDVHYSQRFWQQDANMHGAHPFGLGFNYWRQCIIARRPFPKGKFEM